MTHTSTIDASNPIRPQAEHASRGRRVVDAPVRMFHWLFALTFAGAWLTAESEHWRALHVTLGYTFAGLLGLRIVLGLVGPRQARLVSMWRKLAGASPWLKSVVQGAPAKRINWRQGQNLLMTGVIVTLLVTVVPLTLSGYATYNDWGGEWLEELHEFFANVFLVAVLVHLGLIAVLSAIRRQNQALPMLTGRIAGGGPDLVRKDRRWLAAVLLIGVIGFGTWQWQQVTDGPLPRAEVARHSVQSRHHRD